MLTPCPHCDQQVVPDGDGACPLCGGAVLEPGSNPELPAPDTTGGPADDEQGGGPCRETAAVDTSPTECDAIDADAIDADAAEHDAVECEPAAPPGHPQSAAAKGDETPVWAQMSDDLVAPEGLVGDDDDEEEDDVVEADAEEPPASLRRDESSVPPTVESVAPPGADSATAAAVSSRTASAATPGLLIPCVLLAAVLVVQLLIAVWIKQAEHTAAFAPVFGFAAMLILGIGALFALGRGAADKVGLRSFTSFQFLLLLFAAVPASVLAAQVRNLFSHLCESWPSWSRPTVSNEFPHLALAIAGLCVVPAIAQELVFRGVIGRALIAKFGAFIGMLLTCLAFAAAYVFPESIAPAFVLAVVFQIVFVATRSLAAAMVLNALCATAALLVQCYPDSLSIPGYSHPQVNPFISTELLLASGTVLVAILAALYFTRTRYLTSEGRAWTPGYCSLERPPREAPTQIHSPDAHGGLVILVVAIFGCFIVMLFWEGERGAKAVEEYNRSKVAIPPSFPPPSPPPQMNNGMPQPGMPGGMGKGGPGGGKFKAKPAKAPFGKGPPQDPLTEGSPKASDRPRRPEGDNDGVVPKVSTKDRIPSDEKPPQRPESSPPESLEADPSPADLLPPAREPIS